MKYYIEYVDFTLPRYKAELGWACNPAYDGKGHERFVGRLLMHHDNQKTGGTEIYDYSRLGHNPMEAMNFVTHEAFESLNDADNHTVAAYAKHIKDVIMTMAYFDNKATRNE